MPTTIVVHEHVGHWSASFADAPHEGHGGDAPSTAIRRLVESHPDRGLRLDRIRSDDEAAGPDRLVFVVPCEGDVCRDCGGTGSYVGLATVEACRTCGGKG